MRLRDWLWYPTAVRTRKGAGESISDPFYYTPRRYLTGSVGCGGFFCARDWGIALTAPRRERLHDQPRADPAKVRRVVNGIRHGPVLPRIPTNRGAGRAPESPGALTLGAGIVRFVSPCHSSQRNRHGSCGHHGDQQFLEQLVLPSDSRDAVDVPDRSTLSRALAASCALLDDSAYCFRLAGLVSGLCLGHFRLPISVFCRAELRPGRHLNSGLDLWIRA